MLKDDSASQLETINNIVFTRREIDIIACILNLRSAKKMALFLSISPKTVKNHIRNIMIKLGCNSQENIIDFIEKSSKYVLMKKHYSILLIQFYFESELKKISSYCIKNNITCLIVFDNNDPLPFIDCLKNNLKLSGIKVLVENLEACESTMNIHDKIKSKHFDHIIYNLSSKSMERLHHNNQDIENSYFFQLRNQYSIPILFVSCQDSVSVLPENLLSFDYIALTKQESYYCFIFSILKKILPSYNFDKNILDFKKQYEILLNPASPSIWIEKTTSSQDETITSIPKGNILLKKNHTIKFLLIFSVVFLILYVVSFHESHIPEFKIGSSSNNIAGRYLELLEDEQRRNLKLTGKLKQLNFPKLKKKFIEASNVLQKLDNTSSEDAKKLVKFLEKCFPFKNKVNEKIHKLFFLMAAYYGKLAFVQELVEKVPFSLLNVKDYYGNTAPMLAAAGNQLDTFEWLIKKDAPFVNHKNIEGNSALILATLNLPDDEVLSFDERKKSLKIIESVVEHDPGSIHRAGHKGCTPLLIAGAKGNMTAMQYFLDKIAPGNDEQHRVLLETEKNIDGNNVLLLAAYNGRKSFLKSLHEKGISIHQKNNYNTTVFMQAASAGSIETMDLIYQISSGTQNINYNPNLIKEKNNFGHTALFLSAYDNRLNAFRWILEKLKENYFNNNEEAIINYINNARNAEGDTLLHVLINGMSANTRETHFNTGLLDILLKYININTHSKDSDGNLNDTPLMRAASYGSLNIVKYLVEKCDANISIKTSTGHTAIDFVAMEGRGQYKEVIEYLWRIQSIKEGKDLNEIKKETTKNLFLLSAEYGQKGVMEWLLENYPELIESHSEDGDNALLLAAKNFHIDVIEFIFNWDRKTAVQFVFERKTINSENLLERLIREEINTTVKSISLGKYIEQKIGIPSQINKNSTYRHGYQHGNPNYKWKPLEIDIDNLSTRSVQPWSPYYLTPVEKK